MKILLGITALDTLCKALGYNPALVSRLKIDVMYDGVAKVEVEGFADAETFEAFAKALTDADAVILEGQ